MWGIIILIVGVVLVVYGSLITFGFIKTDISKNSEFDKKLISKKDRYFLGRYNDGIQFIIAGLVAIFIGLVIYLS